MIHYVMSVISMNPHGDILCCARCLAVLLLLSLSDAQLMRRHSSRAASRRSRLQGALREALAKVSAEQVLFVEDGDAAEG